jgi:hypothetical protein
VSINDGAFDNLGFHGRVPLKIFRKIIFVVIRYGEVGRDVPFKNHHTIFVAVSKHYSYFKTELVLQS